MAPTQTSRSADTTGTLRRQEQTVTLPAALPVGARWNRGYSTVHNVTEHISHDVEVTEVREPVPTTWHELQKRHVPTAKSCRHYAPLVRC